MLFSRGVSHPDVCAIGHLTFQSVTQSRGARPVWNFTSRCHRIDKKDKQIRWTNQDSIRHMVFQVRAVAREDPQSVAWHVCKCTRRPPERSMTCVCACVCASATEDLQSVRFKKRTQSAFKLTWTLLPHPIPSPNAWYCVPCMFKLALMFLSHPTQAPPRMTHTQIALWVSRYTWFSDMITLLSNNLHIT